MLNHHPNADLDVIEQYVQTLDVEPVDDLAARRMAQELLRRIATEENVALANVPSMPPATPTISIPPTLLARTIAASGYVVAAIVIAFCLLRNCAPQISRGQVALQVGNLNSASLQNTAGHSSSSSPKAVELQQHPAVSSANHDAVANVKVTTAIECTDGSLERLYQVKAGDTLSEISQRYYGSLKHWPAIAQANPELVPEKIRPGVIIRLPAITGVVVQ